jgi:hypothetical protein
MMNTILLLGWLAMLGISYLGSLALLKRAGLL